MGDDKLAVGGNGLLVKDTSGLFKEILDRLGGEKGDEWKEFLQVVILLPEEIRRKLIPTIEEIVFGGKKDVAEEFIKFLDGKLCWEKFQNPYLRKIADGKLAATSGKRTLAKMKELFVIYFDLNFERYGTDVEGEAKPETLFEIFEQVKDGMFNKIFGAFGVVLDNLCLSQDQIVSFVEKHADKLHPYGTFFLFKVGNEFFVGDVRRTSGGSFSACLDHLSGSCVCPLGIRYRFVFPQQTSVA